MCGRYNINISDWKKSQEIKKQLKVQKLEGFKTGDVSPGDRCLVIVPNGKGIKLDIKKWGMERLMVFINAKIETIREGKIFKNTKRCAVIASGFYEWKDSNKYFFNTEEEFIYLAGIYDDKGNMAIVTKPADESMCEIHDMMPIVMNQEEMLSYLSEKDDNVSFKKFLISCDEEQLSLL